MDFFLHVFPAHDDIWVLLYLWHPPPQKNFFDQVYNKCRCPSSGSPWPKSHIITNKNIKGTEKNFISQRKRCLELVVWQIARNPSLVCFVFFAAFRLLFYSSVFGFIFRRLMLCPTFTAHNSDNDPVFSENGGGSGPLLWCTLLQ